ncbi:MAG: hypothetical protein DHS20C21_03390 [Gemmatimonadota bacterium]|nr:MAG: hypothetical protein DHS20C21_03390 [Gemmatimonadota bacterium]
MWLASTPADSVSWGDIIVQSQGPGLTLGPLVAESGVEVSPGLSGPGSGHYIVEFISPGCVGGPTLVGTFAATDWGGRVCFALDSAWPCSWACDWEERGATLADYQGFSSSGPPCVDSAGPRQECGSYPAVDSGTWGKTKALYRN